LRGKWYIWATQHLTSVGNGLMRKCSELRNVSYRRTVGNNAKRHPAQKNFHDDLDLVV
jgi:hypothetical protein